MSWNKHKIISIITCGLSSAGTIGVAYLATKDSKKEIKEDSKIKYFIKKYWRTSLAVTGVVATNIISTVYSCSTVAGLAASSAALAVSYRKLNDAIDNNVSPEDKQKIIRELVSDLKNETTNDKEYYYTEYTGPFIARPEDLAMAFKAINDNLNDQKTSRNFFKLKDFLDIAKAELVYPADFIPYKDFGWSAEYLYEVFGKPYVHMLEGSDEMEYWDRIANDNSISVNVIKFEEDPIYLDKEYFGGGEENE